MSLAFTTAGQGPALVFVPWVPFSNIQMERQRLVAAGESNRQIARRLGLSPHTAERHVANLYRKIGARGRADATRTPCAAAWPNGFPPSGLHGFGEVGQGWDPP